MSFVKDHINATVISPVSNEIRNLEFLRTCKNQIFVEIQKQPPEVLSKKKCS